jgi:hypothetical protein
MFATPATITVRRVSLCPLPLFTEVLLARAHRIKPLPPSGLGLSTWFTRKRISREAGLEIAEADGFFATQDPAIGFEIHAGSLAAARERAIEAGIAAEMIDDVVAILRAAKAGGYEWVTSPFLFDLVLRKPQAM